MLTLFNQERVTELYGMEMREEGKEQSSGKELSSDVHPGEAISRGDPQICGGIGAV